MDNITENQKATLDELAGRGLRSVSWSEDRGVAAYARGEFGDMGSEALSSVLRFLQEFGEVFGPSGLAEGLRHVRTRTDHLGWLHLEFQQVHRLPGQPDLTSAAGAAPRAVDVYGGFIIAHVDAGSRLVEIQSSCWRDVFVIDQEPMRESELREVAARDLARSPGIGRLMSSGQTRALERFAVRGEPQLLILPFQGGFRWAWRVRGVLARRSQPSGGRIDFLPAEAFFDAESGERLMDGVMGSDAENPDSGSGLSSLPFGGPFAGHPLDIVRLDASNTYRLRDTTHGRDIITYDRAGAFPDYLETADLLTDGAFQVSTDNDGDKTWDRVAADETPSEIIASQQPEVDAHYHAGQIYEWYDALAGPGGRAGFDDNNYGSFVPANMPVHVLAQVAMDGADCYTNQNEEGKSVTFMHIGNEIAPSSHRAWGASPFVMCHEYQHGITAHSVASPAPGFPIGFSDWRRAMSEGLSDVFGGLFSDGWYAASDISPAGTMLRNLAYPRDGAVSSPGGKDHYADIDEPSVSNFAYERGQILAHCAYLMSQGGVHQRAGRTPELIPTHGLGKEDIGGLSVATAALIWYRMMATRFGAVGPYDTEEAFRRIRTECIASAIDLYGEDSHEHREVVQAFYAVGLHPPGETYGADVTCLPWGFRWRFSRPYVGLPSPDWASLDLFINNGEGSEWNAVVNAEDSDVVFENTIYCRVRNVGDQTANNVRVAFQYARYGTAPVSWSAVRDQEGVAAELVVGTLAPGASNFDMEAQNSPPADAGVAWHIPPLPADEEVDHFCIRATVTANNDVHPFNNTIQSNIAYDVVSAMMAKSFAFTIGNPTPDRLPATLVIDTSLPPSWRAAIREDLDGIILDPNEERVVHLDVERPAGPDFEQPLDGAVRGKMWGEITGRFSGTLTDTSGTPPQLNGTLAARIAGGVINGRFRGKVNLTRAEIEGDLMGSFQCGGRGRRVCVKIKACLRPLRRVNIRQIGVADVFGGVTFQFQLPMPARCEWSTSPVDTVYKPGLFERPHNGGESPTSPGTHEGKVLEVLYDCFGEFEGCVLDFCGKRLRCRATEAAMESALLRAFRHRWTVRIAFDDGRRIRSIALLA